MNGEFAFEQTLLLMVWILPLPLLATVAQIRHRQQPWIWLQGACLVGLAGLEIAAEIGPVTGMFRWFADRETISLAVVYLLLATAQAESHAQEHPGRGLARRILSLSAVGLAVATAFSPERLRVPAMLVLSALALAHEAAASFVPAPLWRRALRTATMLLFSGSLFWPPLALPLATATALSVALDAAFRLRDETRRRLQRTRDSLQPVALQQLLTGAAGADDDGDVESLPLDRLDPLLQFAIQGTGARGGAVFLYQENRTEVGTLSRQLRCAAARGAMSKAGSSPPLAAQILLSRMRTDLVQAQPVPSGHVTDSIPMGLWGVSSLLAVPIRARARTMGLLVVSGSPESVFSLSDRQLLEFLGQQTAFSLHYDTVYHQLTQESRLSGEFEIASRIQKSLLPDRLPSVANLEMANLVVPAREVGGDYVDLIPLGDDQMLAVIGDVSGKGLGPGMIMLIVRTTLHVLADLRPESPSNRLLQGLEERLVPQLDPLTFMTFAALRWSGRDRLLHWTGAGHEHILWYVRQEGKVQRIRTGGLALGLRRDSFPLREEKRLALSPGDVVVLYTDGVTDLRDPEGQSWGLDRLVACIEAHAESSPAELVQAIHAELEAFRRNCPAPDDRTLLVLKCA